ncbi:hypothetical protein EQW76_13180 [Rhizobium sp. rho-13.1]|nr:hypothetical protein EQW76_13180 [Rhizobium sp. rho-13.1]TQY13691.1 hypothetical protein EQW74_14755 [Rhizobium sp. rho-1.1]
MPNPLKSNRAWDAHQTLIPVPVTGIQSRRVRAVGGLSVGGEVSIAQRLGRLDSCDGHRNEGGRGWLFPVL